MFCAEKNHNFLEAQIKSQTQEFISTQWGGGVGETQHGDDIG